MTETKYTLTLKIFLTSHKFNLFQVIFFSEVRIAIGAERTKMQVVVTKARTISEEKLNGLSDELKIALDKNADENLSS